MASDVPSKTDGTAQAPGDELVGRISNRCTEPDPPGLGIYVHVPWCLRKCPYCDFNSHTLRGELDEARYLQALLEDLDHDLETAPDRLVETVFIGGGTPSLLTGETVAALLAGIRQRVALAADAEITLEANPGAVDAVHFLDYRRAEVNRLSIGVQSFDAAQLQRLGRIHDPRQAVEAFEAARVAGFDNINLDLMFGLPEQTVAEALADLEQALALAPEHLSWYQLTLEPNTLFHARPPALPEEEVLWEIQEAGLALLAEAGYRRYEISAFARGGRRCRHNLNYWTFGDYLGIGAGAHGKRTTGGAVVRYWKERHPERYMEAPRVRGERRVGEGELPLEFLMNALRLVEGVEEALFRRRTGLSLARLEPALSRARARGLMVEGRLQATPRGLDFLNDLLLEFDHE